MWSCCVTDLARRAHELSKHDAASSKTFSSLLLWRRRKRRQRTSEGLLWRPWPIRRSSIDKWSNDLQASLPLASFPKDSGHNVAKPLRV